MSEQTHPGGEHFTLIDRERLITAGADLKNLREDVLELKRSLYDGDNRFTTLVSTQGNRFESLLNTQANRFEGLLNAQGTRFEALVNAQQTKFEALVAKIEAKVEAQAKEYGVRIGKLENYKYWLMGAVAASGVLGGILGAKLFHP
jgi:hypothetical protein